MRSSELPACWPRGLVCGLPAAGEAAALDGWVVSKDDVVEEPGEVTGAEFGFSVSRASRRFCCSRTSCFSCSTSERRSASAGRGFVVAAVPEDCGDELRAVCGSEVWPPAAAARAASVRTVRNECLADFIKCNPLLFCWWDNSLEQRLGTENSGETIRKLVARM